MARLTIKALAMAAWIISAKYNMVEENSQSLISSCVSPPPWYKSDLTPWLQLDKWSTCGLRWGRTVGHVGREIDRIPQSRCLYSSVLATYILLPQMTGETRNHQNATCEQLR